MKIYQLIEILKQRDQNDAVLIPSGDDTLTDCFLLRTLKTDVVSGPRHVALIPLEGRLRNVWQEGSMAYGKEEAKPRQKTAAEHMADAVAEDTGR